jgi:hypothetical protein
VSNGDPALVHDVVVNGPATHALVIGCGDYPHLLGGSGTTCANPDGMGQLSSPPVSARLVAEWLIETYHDPTKPLATLALLLSEAGSPDFVNPATGVAHAVQLADGDNVETAIPRWITRADLSSDNRVIFYFCGHGTAQGTDTALLLSDYGEDSLNEFKGALDFETLYRGMNRAAAAEQVYFVDACRANSDTLIEATGLGGARVPVRPGPRPSGSPKRLPAKFYATLAGDQAFGLPGMPSIFTDALLKSLRGAASDLSTDGSGEWRVDTALLKRAIDHLMRRPVDAGEHVPVQFAPAGELMTFDLHVLREPPTIPVFVRCQQHAENEQAEFQCTQGGDPVKTRPAGDVDPAHPARDWELELALGNYDFSATLPGGKSRTLNQCAVGPTHRVYTLQEPRP